MNTFAAFHYDTVFDNTSICLLFSASDGPFKCIREIRGKDKVCICFNPSLILFPQLTPEEQEKRRVRRERNKLAAAKCRNRRRELTDRLQGVSLPVFLLSKMASCDNYMQCVMLHN